MFHGSLPPRLFLLGYYYSVILWYDHAMVLLLNFLMLFKIFDLFFPLYVIIIKFYHFYLG